jgi:SET domain-containing protein
VGPPDDHGRLSPERTVPYVGDSYHSPKIALRRVDHREAGIFAVRPIRKGEVLTVSAGVVIPYSKVRRLPWASRRFCFYVEHGYYLAPADPRRVGLGFYMNHSCSPNAGDRRGTLALTAVALRNIRKGEEITCDYRPVLDYNDTRYRPVVHFDCRCPARRCRGLIRA